jgi:hypothetical protein
MDKAICLNTGNSWGGARWLVYLAPHADMERCISRAYVYAYTADEAIKKAQDLALPSHYRQYIN